MKISVKRIISLFIISLLLLGSLSACQQKTASPDQSSSSASQSQASGSEANPSQEPVTIRYWTPLQFGEMVTATNYMELPVFQEIEKNLGIKLEIIHPPLEEQAADEKFNLLLVSGDLPDIIEYKWYEKYSGGPAKAAADGILIPMNDLIDQYAPDLKSVLDDPGIENQLAAKLMTAEDGSIYTIPMLILDDFVPIWRGPVFRKDWLDEFNLETPTTIDEWYEVLKIFRDQKGIDSAFSMDINAALGWSNDFVGAFGTAPTFFQDKGTVKYGPIEPGYKEFLATMAKWYAEGLVDKDFAKIDNDVQRSKILNDKIGAFYGNVGGYIGTLTDAKADEDTTFKLIGVTHPSAVKGERAIIAQKDSPAVLENNSAGITTSSKIPEECMKLLNYGFTEEGHMLYNFGIEGVTYNMVDGFPKFTDLMLNNPDGLAFKQIATYYMRTHGTAPAIDDPRYVQQEYKYPQQVEAVTNWGQFDSSYRYPPISVNAEDGDRFANIMNDVTTYVLEMSIKFIQGDRPIDQFDAFVEEIKAMKIEEAIAIKQKDLDAFNARG